MPLLFDHPRQIHDALIRALPEKSILQNELWVNDGHGNVSVQFTYHNINLLVTGIGTVCELNDGVRTITVVCMLIRELLVKTKKQ